MLAILLLLALSLMLAGYIVRRAVLAFGAAGGWALLCIYAITLSAHPWDIYYGLGFLAFGLAVVSALEPMIMREKTAGTEDEKLDDIGKAEKVWHGIRNRRKPKEPKPEDKYHV